MPVGVAGFFLSPTHCLRSMVDPPHPGLSGQYVWSTGASSPLHCAECLQTEGPETPLDTYEVASGRDPWGPLALGRVVLPLAVLSLVAFLCPSTPQRYALYPLGGEACLRPVALGGLLVALAYPFGASQKVYLVPFGGT